MRKGLLPHSQRRHSELEPHSDPDPTGRATRTPAPGHTTPTRLRCGTTATMRHRTQPRTTRTPTQSMTSVASCLDRAGGASGTPGGTGCDNGRRAVGHENVNVRWRVRWGDGGHLVLWGGVARPEPCDVPVPPSVYRRPGGFVVFTTTTVPDRRAQVSLPPSGCHTPTPGRCRTAHTLLRGSFTIRSYVRGGLVVVGARTGQADLPSFPSVLARRVVNPGTPCPLVLERRIW